MPVSRRLRENEGMGTSPLHSDRIHGPGRRDHESLPDATASGLLGYARSVLERDWLAGEFPQRCSDQDRNYIYGTDWTALSSRLPAVIPGLRWPLGHNDGELEDEQLFDLLEFLGRYVALPIEGAYHSFLGHHSLTFNRQAGALQFRNDVNELLARGGAAYDMSPALTINRLGPPEVYATLSALNPATGDFELDELVEQGRTLYTSRNPKDRLVALQAFWSALERLKTLDVPGQGNKKLSAEALLNHIPSTPVRDAVRADLFAVTSLGNGFRIRHHETGTAELPVEAYDYFAGRVTTVILYLLAQSDRLA